MISLLFGTCLLLLKRIIYDTLIYRGTSEENEMKYVVLLGDGMADDPQETKGGKTPLESAFTPNMDMIADRGELGLADTVPDGMEAGSDVANMSVLGFDPSKYYAGRAAIEAAALGIKLAPGEAAFRMNLVTYGNEDNELTMDDYSGGHPEEEEQKQIVADLVNELSDLPLRLVPGVSFRNICIISDFGDDPDLKPPHDYAGSKVKDILPTGPGAEMILDIQERAKNILEDHPVNQKRKEKGKPPINGVWLWGTGRAIEMPTFKEMHNLSGAVVTGVDLVRGLAKLLDMEIVEVEGATGYVDTNFEGKADAVIEVLDNVDFVFLHVEAPDEAGHEGDLDLKIKAIEDFDKRTVGPVLSGLTKFDDYKVIVLPDHETPVQERGHRGNPVPFAIASKKSLKEKGPGKVKFDENHAREQSDQPVPAKVLLATRLFS
jgi:2,3-bisphosphoglycerate-independent phosphoglycerate mutase